MRSRLLFELQHHDHITPALIQLHWLPIRWRRWRIHYKLCTLMHAVHTGYCPPYLTDIPEADCDQQTPRTTLHHVYVLNLAGTLKMRNMKIRHQIAGVKNASHENTGKRHYGTPTQLHSKKYCSCSWLRGSTTSSRPFCVRQQHNCVGLLVPLRPGTHEVTQEAGPDWCVQKWRNNPARLSMLVSTTSSSRHWCHSWVPWNQGHDTDKLGLQGTTGLAVLLRPTTVAE